MARLSPPSDFTCEIRAAEQFDFTNLSRDTVFVCVLCCRCVIFKIPISPLTIIFVDAFWYVLTYTSPLSPTHRHEKTSAQARVGSPAEKPSGTKPTGLGTRTGFSSRFIGLSRWMSGRTIRRVEAGH